MNRLWETIRSLKVVGVVIFVAVTVWVAGWERDLRQKVENGYYVPGPTPRELRELSQQVRLEHATAGAPIWLAD